MVWLKDDVVDDEAYKAVIVFVFSGTAAHFIIPAILIRYFPIHSALSGTLETLIRRISAPDFVSQ
jgi:hypothetical protein